MTAQAARSLDETSKQLVSEKRSHPGQGGTAGAL